MNSNPFYYFSDERELDKRIHLNEFAKQLRDLADNDYIAARAIYRRGHLTHASYLAHQSIEKYFKAVLLFLEVETRSHLHNIVLLSESVKEKGILLNQRSIDLVCSLDGLNNVSRYRSGSFHIDRSFIYDLDYFVLDIRPHVQGRWVENENHIPLNPYQIMSGHERKDCLIFLSGVIEKILKSKTKKVESHYEDLVWNNDYFCLEKNTKKKVLLGSYSSNFQYNLDSIKDREIARYVSRFYKFETEIEYYLKSKKESDRLQIIKKKIDLF